MRGRVPQGVWEQYLESTQAIHSCKPEGADDLSLREAWLHWFESSPYIRELAGFMEAYGAWLENAANDGKVMRRLHSMDHRPDRPRLTQPIADREALCQLLEAYIVRAETLSDDLV